MADLPINISTNSSEKIILDFFFRSVYVVVACVNCHFEFYLDF